MTRLRGKLTYANVMSTVAVFLALGGAVAVAAVPDGNGVISACYQVQKDGVTPVAADGNVRIIDPSAGQTCNPVGGAGAEEHALSWNASGPPGPEGAAGPSGSPGAAGPQGATGPAGAAVSIDGQTFTLGDGKTLAPPVSLVPPLQAPPGGRPVGTMTFGAGAGAGAGGGAASSGVLAWQLVGGSGGTARGIQLVIPAGKSSPTLQQWCVTGKHIKSGIITVRKATAGGAPQTITLTNATVVSYAPFDDKGKGSDESPKESVTFEYGGLQVRYGTQSPNGQTETGK